MEPLIVSPGRPREWDQHLIGIRWAIHEWERGRLSDENTLRAIRAYLDDRDANYE